MAKVPQLKPVKTSKAAGGTGRIRTHVHHHKIVASIVCYCSGSLLVSSKIITGVTIGLPVSAIVVTSDDMGCQEDSQTLKKQMFNFVLLEK